MSYGASPDSKHPPGTAVPEDVRFLVDVNVGKLTKWLRVLGYDTAYVRAPEGGPDAPDDVLLALALREGRVLLTKDTHIPQRRLVASGRVRTLLIEGELVASQLRQVAMVFGLDRTRAGSRCVACGASLIPLSKEALTPVVKGTAHELVPPYVWATQEVFNRCAGCGRVYWRGTHWTRMEAFLDGVFGAVLAQQPHPVEGNQ